MAGGDFVEEYRSCLVEDLSVNSKPVIDNLTTLAGENKASAAALAEAISQRILNCDAEAKLPALYLLDSVSKNVGEPFLTLFSKNLPEVFCCVWKTTNAAIHKHLLKLYFTWKTVFPASTLLMIDSAMRQQSSPPSSEAKTIKTAGKLSTLPSKQDDIQQCPAGEPLGETNVGEIASSSKRTNGVTKAEQGVGKKSSEVGQVSDGITVDVSTLVSLLLQSAATGVDGKGDAGSCVLEAKNLTPAVVKAEDPVVLDILREGSKSAKPKFLDWRFQIRRDRRRKTYRTRKWYAAPERWIQDCNPVGISPLELVAKLTEVKVKLQEKHIVLIDDDNPQTHCEISGDKLEKYFDEELEDWYYKDCKRVFGEEAAANGVREGTIVIVSCLRKPGDPRSDELLDLNPVASMVRAQGVSSALVKAAQGTGDDLRLQKANGKRKLDLPEANGFHGKKIKENEEIKIKGEAVL